MSSTKWGIAAVLAAATSATLFYFGTGLRPMSWCTWLAPLPVLVLAPRVSARTAFTAACAAWLGGETVMWGYFLDTLRIPAAIAVAVIVGSALVFGRPRCPGADAPPASPDGRRCRPGGVGCARIRHVGRDAERCLVEPGLHPS